LSVFYYYTSAITGIWIILGFYVQWETSHYERH